MVPTIMTVPRPFTTVNSREATVKRIRVTTKDLSPPSSAPFLIMVSLIRVFSIIMPSHPAKTETIMASASLIAPLWITALIKPTSAPVSSTANAGTPPIRQMPTVSTSSAITVGILLVSIKAMIATMKAIIRIPCNINFFSFSSPSFFIH